MRAPIRPRDLVAIAVVSVFALAAAGTHVVRSGETLSGIAARNGVSVSALVDANGLADPDLIVAGQELSIPGGSSGAGGTGTYVVQKGDTLARIAAKFHTTVSALASANGIADPDLIVAGRSLTVPGSGGGGSSPASSGGATSSGKQLVGQRHLVRSGDTIGGIASRYGVASSDFVRWNGLVDGKLYATTSLLLYDPGTLPGANAASGPQTHTVAKGETLSGIASKYGTSVSAIAKASGLADADTIRIGQKLTVPGSGGGGIACPVPGATFFDDWGFPRSGGRYHAGNDMFAAKGTPVVAPVSGWVDIATGSIGGHQFRLTAADGSLWFGSHMDRFAKTGTVSAGDVIGYVGNTGNAAGGPTHLHFEVHPGPNAVNPFPLLHSVC